MRKPLTLPQITADWLLERVVEREGCLVWKLQCCNDGKDPRAVINSHKWNVRRMVWAAFHGRQPRSDRLMCVTCDTPACVDPAHIVAYTRSQAAAGEPRSLATRAKIAKAKRRFDRLPKEAIAEVLASPLKGEDEAKRWGMCKSSINKIRAGTMRRDYSSPFAGLGA